MTKKYTGVSDATMTRIEKYAPLVTSSTIMDNELYIKHDVKRGLRDINGKGVVCGLTEISEIVSSVTDENGNAHGCPGELYYRGIEIRDLINGFINEQRFGFEETAYLLLFGTLPAKDSLKDFNSILSEFRELPRYFVRDVVMKAPSTDMMNALSRCVLSLYPYDETADDISIPNVLKQVLDLLVKIPLLSVYAYNTYRHYHGGESLVIHKPLLNASTAENILHLLREDGSFTKLEAVVLDICLVLHAEHGGGNNSSFTTHVVSSSGTDTYSAIAASLGSLKGPRHGGANIKVAQMFDDMKSNLKDFSEASISDYLIKLLNKEAFDNSGLIYGMGHAVYSQSDPRADVLKEYVQKLAAEKGLEEEYGIYEKVERLAPVIISDKRKIYKGVSANVDFYSGFLYNMLGLPHELYTPIFAIARMAGWGAHRLEELANNGKIIRPGYVSVAGRNDYVPLNLRK